MGRSCSSAAAAAAAEGRKEHWRRTHLVLELGRVAPVHGHGGAVHVQLADDAHATLRAADELGPEGALVGALAEAEEAVISEIQRCLPQLRKRGILKLELVLKTDDNYSDW